MANKKGIVVIGATSAIAEHCARLWVEDAPIDLTLVGRDAGRVERVAADLRVRSPGSAIRAVEAEFLEPAAIQATVDSIFARGPVDIVLIAHGSLPEQAVCQNDLAACREALEVNGISPALYAEAFAKHMARANHGTLALIASVAGDRGRKSNYVYGSAKGLLARYAQGLQHRFARTGVKVVLIKLGPTDTPMTAHLKAKNAKLAPATGAAQVIVRSIAKGHSDIYAPKKWHLIMSIVRLLPKPIFHRLDI